MLTKPDTLRQMQERRADCHLEETDLNYAHRKRRPRYGGFNRFGESEDI